MKEKIKDKIDALIVYILSKPVIKLTGEDYGILSTELERMKSEEDAEARKQRMIDLMSATFISDK